MILFLPSFLIFFRLCVASSLITNNLIFHKFTADSLTFNIKINGENYYPSDQLVTGSSSSTASFSFKQMYDDMVEVIISECSDYPGYFYIVNEDGEATTFESYSTTFYITNQCSNNELGCDLRLSSLTTFPDGISATVYIDNEPIITDYTGG